MRGTESGQKASVAHMNEISVASDLIKRASAANGTRDSENFPSIFSGETEFAL